MFTNVRDRLLQIRLQRDEKEIKVGFLIIGVLIVFLLVNSIYLNFFLYKNQDTSGSRAVELPLPSTPPLPTILPTSPIRSLSPTQPVTILPSNSSIQVSAVKDYFIPLGSGTNQSSDWMDVPGVQATVDFGQYANVKEIHFEASVYLPNAAEQVWVRLFNKTDQHPVWNSDVSMNDNASGYLVSLPITYDKGVKLYQVQMKTQLQAAANLVQARIHVILR